MFQSAPGIDAGRSHIVVVLLVLLISFNPRPASMPGDPPRFQSIGGEHIFHAFPRTSWTRPTRRWQTHSQIV